MPQYTIIANTQRSALYLSFQTNTDARLIAELLTGNPEATAIPCLQTASIELKKRLHLLDAVGESSYEPKRFFNDIPTNHHFLFLSGHIDDRIQIYFLTKEICQIDASQLKSTNLEPIASYLYSHYEMRTFDGSAENRKKIGVYDKSKRKCRFCDKSIPNVSFGNKSHAISRSLGNIGLICLEECDGCNTRFNETIEQDVSNFFLFQLIFKGVNGRNGNRTLRGDNVSITNDTSTRDKTGSDTIKICVDNTLNTHDPQKIAQILSQRFSFSQVKYKPQNIYKCFCKYVLGLMDSRYLPYFKDTIKWINEPLTKHRLPPVWYDSVPGGDFPFIAIMTRKHNHKSIPYCWAILNVSGLRFIFIVPFCSRDKYKFVGKSRVEYFLDGLKNIMPNMELNPISLNGITSVGQEIDFNLEIPPNCVEGRDYFIESNS